MCRCLAASLYGVGTEQIEVDTIELVGVGALVSLGPLLCVAYRSHAFEIRTGNEIRAISVFYQVGKRHARSIGVIDMASHDEGKCTYFAGHRIYESLVVFEPRSTTP